MNYENELVIRAKSGDPNALNLLLDNNKSYIYAIAFSLLKNHEDAEDAVRGVQELAVPYRSYKEPEYPAVKEEGTRRLR